jgi:hypothetical protein
MLSPCQRTEPSLVGDKWLTGRPTHIAAAQFRIRAKRFRGHLYHRPNDVRCVHVVALVEEAGNTIFAATGQQGREQTMVTVSELIAGRQKTLSESWSMFLKHPLNSSIAQVIDRRDTNLPSSYVRWAPAIAIASGSLLKAARQAEYDDRFRKHPRFAYYYYAEIRIKERSGFWFIERGDNVLVFRFGSMPLCTRKYLDGIRLFEHIFRQWGYKYEPPVGPRGYNLRWVRKAPEGILD